MNIFPKAAIALTVTLTLTFSLNLNSQIILSGEMFRRNIFTVKAEVVDSLSKEPISFASAYLRHPGDTIITNFSLTDSLGKAELKEVTRGEYILNVEFMGYRPFAKKIYVRSDFDAKTVLLQVDEKMLEAAKVSAVGNPVEFKQDTVIYNASSFKTLSSDNLSDLLKKMPGIEVGRDGDVKVNGKSVSKITVNGKTFFMGDNKTALDNLPAKIVDKVKVIDKDSESAQFSGIKEEEKEKVMDVELKEEYKKGVFGNVKLGLGASVPGKNDNEFVENKDVLYNFSSMLSTYGEKNQLTAVLGARNITKGDAMVIVYGGAEDEYPSLGYNGIHSTGSIGANLNSDLIKGMEASVSTVFSRETALQRSRVDRTTFKSGSDNLFDTSESLSNGDLRKFNVRMELKNKDTKKYVFSFRPSFSYSDISKTTSGSSSASLGGDVRNSSSSYTSTASKTYSTSGELTLGRKDFGKKRRSLTLSSNYSLSGSDGTSNDVSSTWYALSDSTARRNLHYVNDGNNFSISGNIRYVEPFGDNWALETYAATSYSARKNSKDASNADGTSNGYYSSESDNYFHSYTGRLLAQYNKGKTNIQFGGLISNLKNEIYATSYGLHTKTGEGDWQTTLSPFLRFRTSHKDINYNAYLNSYTSRPSAASIVPSFSIVNPTRVTAGNIYLKPTIRETFSLGCNGKAGKLGYNANVYGDYSKDNQVSAIWFDENSVRYSVPVNTRKPTLQASLYAFLNRPLTKDGKLSLDYDNYTSFNRGVSYQSSGTLDGIDIDAFDYTEFMESFWGDASGDRFYSGESGFQESVTNQFTTSNSIYLECNLEAFSISAGADFTNSRSWYSLDSKANTNIWNNTFFLSPTYTSDHEFEFGSNLGYTIRSGYGAGYNENYWMWDLSVGKSFKAFNLTLSADDILNQAKSLNHSVQEDYVQDSYTNILGRTVLLTLTWNFGKMNSAKSNQARDAMFNMSF